MHKQIKKLSEKISNIKLMISKRIVGHNDLIEEVLLCLFSGGNILLEGVPGLGKTELVKALSEIMDLDYSRIQFTPDLMPADILGTKMLYQDETGKTEIKFEKGPVFCQLLLADEINRATPKTQSALLEIMQEHTVTIFNNTHRLKEPFIVLATQNPIEMEGTYPLPEAQVDRFMFKSLVVFPDEMDLCNILNKTTGGNKINLDNIITSKELYDFQKLIENIVVPEIVYKKVSELIVSLHPEKENSLEIVKKYVEFGPSPRAAQAMIRAAKSLAAFQGRYNVSLEDLKRIFVPSLRHRILLNFEGQSKYKNIDLFLQEISVD